MTGGGRDEGGGSAEAFGPIDAGALRDIRDVFREQEPLVDSASLDDQLNPTTLSIHLPGIGEATDARFDVRWSLSGNYSFHYTDDHGRDFRFDRHPKPGSPERHFHPPPDAPSSPVEESCIRVSEAPLVTRAVLTEWRFAYEAEAFDGLNAAENPP